MKKPRFSSRSDATGWTQEEKERKGKKTKLTVDKSVVRGMKVTGAYKNLE